MSPPGSSPQLPSHGNVGSWGWAGPRRTFGLSPTTHVQGLAKTPAPFLPSVLESARSLGVSVIPELPSPAQVPHTPQGWEGFVSWNPLPPLPGSLLKLSRWSFLRGLPNQSPSWEGLCREGSRTRHSVGLPDGGRLRPPKGLLSNCPLQDTRDLQAAS